MEQMPKRGINWRALGGAVGVYVSLHRHRFGWWAKVTIPVAVLLALINAKTGIEFAVRNRAWPIRVLAGIAGVSLSPWVHWPALLLAAGYLIWQHSRDTKRIAIAEAKLEVQDAAAGGAVFAPTIVATTPGYISAATWNEGRWWLSLSRPTDEVGGFRVTIRDDLGGATRKSFAQAGRTIIVRFPEDFEPQGIAATKQPWGGYTVLWEDYRLVDDPEAPAGKRSELAGQVTSQFTWHP